MHKKKIIAGTLTVALVILGACGLVSAKTEGNFPFSQTSDSSSGKTFRFTDANGEEYEATLNENIDQSPYDADSFVLDGSKMHYEDDTYTSRLGVDVSYYQGDIDWDKVKAAGYDFAIIRAGYRGYGDEGKLKADENFLKNVEGAHAAGLDVGVYFFSQAVSAQEAREEADFVINLLEENNITLELPIVYDPEKVADSSSRTYNLSNDQFTENCLAFCEEIQTSGYTPAVYTTMLWEVYTLDLEQLTGIPLWYADYVDKPQTPYNFRWWQYSNSTKVDGIPVECDVDIELYRK